MAWITAGVGLAGAPLACAGPAEVAISHLEKILEGDVNLKVGTDTAISPHVGPAKASQIQEHIKRMALDLAGGELEPGQVRIDGDLAAVIVHKREGYDPEKVAAFAVALVKADDDRWLPAPVSASFENTGVTLDFELRRRAADLERWMLRERSRVLDVLRDEQVERLRRDIGAAITRDELESKTVAEMADAFLDACRDGNRLRLLGMLGGLSDPLPRNWASRLRAVELATSPSDRTPKAWRVLISPEVPRAVVLEESAVKDGLFTVGFIDPAGEVPRGGVPAVDLLHIDMQRDSAGGWRLNLPANLMDTDAEEKPARDEDNPFDADLLDAFPTRFREAYPASPQQTPELLWKEMQAAMNSSTPTDLLRLLAIPADNPEQARVALGRATRFWWQLRSASGGRSVVPLAFEHDGDQAMAMAQLYAFREPERTDLRAFHMVRQADGWMWQSTGRQEPPVPVSATLTTWRDQQEKIWRDTWSDTLLTPTAKLTSLTPDSPANPEASEKLVRQWLDAISASDLDGCLAMSAVLDDEEGRLRLLRNLGYELSTQITDIEGDVVTRSGKHWTVVCYRRRDDANPGMALMPVITTPMGPRLLPELDLFVGTRQRDFLNNVALERLDGYAEDEVRADLQKLLQELNREFAPRRR